MAVVTAIVLVAATLHGAHPASASHGEFTESEGIYRVPFADGTEVTVTFDHHDHSGAKDRIDMVGDTDELVAAASGWIRGIVEHHGDDDGRGDGVDKNGDPQDDSLEHSCTDNDEVTGRCSDYNNYVWIEHPNGEWTKYSHPATGSVSDHGWSVGDWIAAGEVIGVQSDVGAADGDHLHHEVAVPTNPGDDLAWTQHGGFIRNGSNVVPRVCDIPDNLYEKGATYTADPCDHDAPTADAGGPYRVDEGTTKLDGTGSSDPEGNPLTFRWEPADNLDDTSLAQPIFAAGDDSTADLTLTVYDQIEALSDDDSATVTVDNVAPTVEFDPDQVEVIDEGGTVTVSAGYRDPGWLDTHTAEIDWDTPAGDTSQPTPVVTDAGNPGPVEGTVSGQFTYGDTGTYDVTVTVTDDDGGQDQATLPLTVDNVAPTVTLDTDGVSDFIDAPTFVTRVDEDLGLSGHVTDPGSDDLSLTWDWDDGTVTEETYLNDPSAGADPFPSPTVNPRDVTDTQANRWTDPGHYSTVTLTATDDDAGQVSDTVDVVVLGDAEVVRGAGYWHKTYDGRRRDGPDDAALVAYLDIVGHASEVFHELRSARSAEEAADLLHPKKASGSLQVQLERQLLATWLNLANGALEFDHVVDTTGDGQADTHVGDALTAAEDARLFGAGRADLEEHKDVLEAINESDDT